MQVLQDRIRQSIAQSRPIQVAGKVTKVVGLLVEGWVPDARVGAMCIIRPGHGMPEVAAEIVGFRHDTALMMPLGDMQGVAPGSSIFPALDNASIGVGPDLMGRVLDGLGRPLDGRPAIIPESHRAIYAQPPNPMLRSVINRPLSLGIKAIDACLTCGDGQRMGIIAGSGVGKSVLLGMICRNTLADVNVVALVGERGREVRQFLEQDLGKEGLARSVVVVATGDRSPVERTRGAFLATAIAEYFRDKNKKVLLCMDSLTRFAMAQREVGLAIGEPPTTRGYPPSSLAWMPRLAERAGPGVGEGSITALYTVLAEADDLDDPIVDTARATLDGHIVLSRDIASRGHYPAVDILSSVSRLMNEIVAPEHRKLSAQVRSILADYEEAKDLVHVGAYMRGSNKKFDIALDRIEAVRSFLCQAQEERFSMQDSLRLLEQAIQGPVES